MPFGPWVDAETRTPVMTMSLRVCACCLSSPRRCCVGLAGAIENVCKNLLRNADDDTSPYLTSSYVLCYMLRDRPRLLLAPETLWTETNVSYPQVSLILNNEQLFAEWKRDIETMAGRIIEMRKELFRLLTEELKTPGNWEHIVNQIGMFRFVCASRIFFLFEIGFGMRFALDANTIVPHCCSFVGDDGEARPGMEWGYARPLWPRMDMLLLKATSCCPATLRHLLLAGTICQEVVWG